MKIEWEVKENKFDTEIRLRVNSIRQPAGRLCLSALEIAPEGDLYVDLIEVRPSYTRLGLATMLMKRAEDMLGYSPLPKKILGTDEAQGFWTARGITTGVEQ